MSERITYPQLLELLRDLVAKGETATLYISTDQNHSVVIGVQAGRIVALSSGLRHGEKAIPLVREMREGSYRREAVAVPHRSKQLPPTEEILALLAGDDVSSLAEPHAASEAGIEPSPTVEIATDHPPPLPLAFDPKRAHKALCELLSDYLGPICSMVCEESEERLGGVHNPRDLEVLIDLLAREIAAPEEAEQFTVRARERLEKMLAQP
jgi:hypothetical protein